MLSPVDDYKSLNLHILYYPGIMDVNNILIDWLHDVKPV